MKIKGTVRNNYNPIIINFRNNYNIRILEYIYSL